MAFLKSLIDGNERDVVRLRRTAQAVNEFGPQLAALSDADLQAKTAEFKSRLEQGESLDDMLPETFAVVREAATRRSACGISTCRSWAARCSTKDASPR